MSDIRRSLQIETEAARGLLDTFETALGDDAEAILGTIEGETNLVEAITKAVDRLDELKKHEEALASLVASYNARRDRFAKQADDLRTAIGLALDAAGLKRLELPQATLSLRATPPSVIINDEAAIPSKFWKQPEPTLSKSAVKEALKAGETVPGATLSNGGTSLHIRGG